MSARSRPHRPGLPVPRMRTAFLRFLAPLAAMAFAAVSAAAAPPAAAVPAGAEARLAALRQKHGADMLYEVDDQLKLIFATSTDRATLDDVKRRLSAHARAIQAGLFTTPLQGYVTVELPREWKGSAQGLYDPVGRSITSKTAGMQLVHEFTHALHYDDMSARGQFHQPWVIEGFGTLYESSQVIGGQAVPRQNHRLKVIQQLVGRNQHVPWATYVAWGRKEFMKAPRNHYSQAQSMMFYLHATGNLRKWYDAYVAGFAADATGAAAFEKAFAKPLPQIEAAWLEWVRLLPDTAVQPE